jgi:hypothetical protein
MKSYSAVAHRGKKSSSLYRAGGFAPKNSQQPFHHLIELLGDYVRFVFMDQLKL